MPTATSLLYIYIYSESPKLKYLAKLMGEICLDAENPRRVLIFTDGPMTLWNVEQLENIFGEGNIRDIKRNELEMLASPGGPADNPEQLQVCFYPGEDDRMDQVNKLPKINPSGSARSSALPSLLVNLSRSGRCCRRYVW